MTNRLADQTSPYLRQHANNPVDWWPFCDEAFALAKETDRPVLLSVGYSSCHWCHVMAHESFEDPEVAALVNEWFVPVKVDREERPDVDAIYMEATQAMTGHGGWPMTVFTDADGRPFFCGTYFPPEHRNGQPSFTQVLSAVHEAFTERRGELVEQAERLTESLRRSIGPAGSHAAAIDAAALDESTMGLIAAFDAEWGGFGRAPKFPQSMSIDHLLRQHVRTGSAAALAAAVTSLDAMAAGGIYDHIGGGFSRYSVDRQWLVPHFEKMLYDNALLLRAYTHAAQVTGEPRFAMVAEGIVDYVMAELSHPDGGRYSAEDADSLPPGAAPGTHPEEGAFYVWRPDEVASVLNRSGLSEHLDDVLAWYGIADSGNFEGASIPNRLHARGHLDRPAPIEAARQALLEARASRPRPGLDDKVLTEWNALFVASLAQAGTALDRPDWVAQAERTAEFLLSALRDEQGRWLRSWQANAGSDSPTSHTPTSDAATSHAATSQSDGGRAQHLAYAADHGALLDAFLCLYEATGLRRWLDEALTVAVALDDLFIESDGTVFSTGTDAPALLVRPREVMDNATPSGASLAATGFLRLGALTGDDRWSVLGQTVLTSMGDVAARHPLGFANMLWAWEMATAGISELVISGDRPDLVEVAHSVFAPTTVLAWGAPDDGPLWEGRSEVGADGRAYLCRDRVCAAPITDADELRSRLR